ncbi:PucR family transcriptional regulator [Streptomyces broussonetiae]|uniref:Helix-turn-helix domain-containing protein n=1 Tax=Streptomyces broussonetiae TaxID=2686304 RepID=A0ABV5EDC4_9ACTN
MTGQGESPERPPAPATAPGQVLDAADRDRLRAAAAHAADRGVPLRALIETHLGRHCEAVPGDAVRRMRDVAIALTEGYERARGAAIRREEEIRHAFVDGLLSGPGDLGRMAELAHRVGFPLTGPHRVAVARAGAAFLASAPATRYVAEAMAAYGDESPSLIATKDGLLICVTAGDGAAACEHFAAQVRRAAVRDSQVAVSRPRPGANGVVHSFREARETLELADRLGVPRPVVHASDLLVFQVLGRDRAAITDLVATVLGGLEQARGGPGLLLETLGAYFDSGCAHTVTARRLGLSVRAVSYRIARVRTLTGYDPALPDQRYALQTATLGARLLNWPAQPLQPPDG